VSFSDADLRAALSEITTGLETLASSNKTLADAIGRSNTQSMQQSRAISDSLRTLTRGAGKDGSPFEKKSAREHVWDFAAESLYYRKGDRAQNYLNKASTITGGLGEGVRGAATSLGLPSSFTQLTQDYNKAIGGVGRAYQDTLAGMQSALQNLPAMMDMGRSLGFVGDQALKSYQNVRQLGVQLQLSTADTLKMTDAYKSTRVFAGTPAQAEQDLRQQMSVAGGAYRGMGMSAEQGMQTNNQALNYFDAAGASQFANTLALAESRTGTQTSQMQIAQRSMQYLEIMSHASVTGPAQNSSSTTSFLTALAAQGQPAFNGGANAGASLMEQSNTQGSLAQNVMISYAMKLHPGENFFDAQNTAQHFSLHQRLAALDSVYGSGPEQDGLKAYLFNGGNRDAYRAMATADKQAQALPQEQQDRLAALNKLQATAQNPLGDDPQDFLTLTNIVSNDAAGHGKEAVMGLIKKNKLEKMTGINSAADIKDPYATLQNILTNRPDIGKNLIDQFSSAPDAVGKTTSGIENAANNGSLNNLDAVNTSLQAEKLAVDGLTSVMGKLLIMLPVATLGSAALSFGGGFLRGFMGGGNLGPGGGGGGGRMGPWMEKMAGDISRSAQCGCGTEDAVRQLSRAPAEAKVPAGATALATAPLRAGFGAPFVEQSPFLVQNLIKTMAQDVALMGGAHALSSATVSQLSQQTGLTPAEIEAAVKQAMTTTGAASSAASGTATASSTVSATDRMIALNAAVGEKLGTSVLSKVETAGQAALAKAGTIGGAVLGTGAAAGQTAVDVAKALGGIAGKAGGVGRGVADEGASVAKDGAETVAGGGRAVVSSIEEARKKKSNDPPGGGFGDIAAAATIIAAIIDAIMQLLNKGRGAPTPKSAPRPGFASSSGSFDPALGTLHPSSSLPQLGPFVNVGGLLVPTLRQSGGGAAGGGLGGGLGSSFGPGGGFGGGGGDSRNNPFSRAIDDNTAATEHLTGSLNKILMGVTGGGTTGALTPNGTGSPLIFGAPFGSGGTKGSPSSGGVAGGAAGGFGFGSPFSPANTTNTTMSGFNQYQPLSEAQYRGIITKAGFPNSPLLSDPGSYTSLMKTAKNANVDPRLLLSIAEQEGGYATALPYMAADKNFTGIKYAGQAGATPGTISSEGNPYAKFSTWDQGWQAMGQTIRNPLIGPYVASGDLRGAMNMWTKGDPNNDAGGQQKRDIYGRILGEAPILSSKVGSAFGNSLNNGAASGNAADVHAMSTNAKMTNAFRAFDPGSGGTDIAGELVSSILSGLEQARPGIASAVAAMFKANASAGGTPPPPNQGGVPAPFTDINLTPARGNR
jgi:hypothetical protein